MPPRVVRISGDEVFVVLMRLEGWEGTRSYKLKTNRIAWKPLTAVIPSSRQGLALLYFRNSDQNVISLYLRRVQREHRRSWQQQHMRTPIPVLYPVVVQRFGGFSEILDKSDY